MYQEFDAHLHTVRFKINYSNDVINTHRPSFCYNCKLVLDKSLLAQDQQHTPFTNILFRLSGHSTLQLTGRYTVK